MDDTTKTFGDFFDQVSETQIPEGQTFLKDWQEGFQESEWQHLRTVCRGDGLIIGLSEDMVAKVQSYMVGTGQEALEFTHGCEFLREIRTVADRFGVDVSDIVNQPLAPNKGPLELNYNTGPELHSQRLRCKLTQFGVLRKLRKRGVEITITEIKAIEEGSRLPTTTQYPIWCEVLNASSAFLQIAARSLQGLERKHMKG